MTSPDSAREAEAATFDAFENYAQSVVEALSTGLEHIPVVKVGVALATVFVTIRDQILARKVVEFLRALDGVPADQRREMIARLEGEPTYGRRVGQHIVELLDRVDSHRKPPMIAAVFAAYARREIGLRMFYRLNNAVERISVTEIDSVRRFKEWRDTRMNRPAGLAGTVEFSVTELSYAGLTTLLAPLGGPEYSPNETCLEFLRLNLDQVR